jgi:hypothetical protein
MKALYFARKQREKLSTWGQEFEMDHLIGNLFIFRMSTEDMTNPGALVFLLLYLLKLSVKSGKEATGTPCLVT